MNLNQMASKPINIRWIRTGSQPNWKIWTNKTGLNVIIFHFNIRGKLSIIRLLCRLDVQLITSMEKWGNQVKVVEEGMRLHWYPKFNNQVLLSVGLIIWGLLWKLNCYTANNLNLWKIYFCVLSLGIVINQ